MASLDIAPKFQLKKGVVQAQSHSGKVIIISQHRTFAMQIKIVYYINTQHKIG
jgi:hypothetical protein